MVYERLAKMWGVRRSTLSGSNLKRPGIWSVLEAWGACWSAHSSTAGCHGPRLPRPPVDGDSAFSFLLMLLFGW